MNRPTLDANNLQLEEKRALLARLLREKANRPQAHPVSFGQQRLWFLDRLEPGSAAYNMPAALRLKGALDAQALEAGLNELVRRHAVLRTTISDVDGEPAQLVHPSATLRMNTRNLGELTIGERERRAHEILSEEARRPFNLMEG